MTKARQRSVLASHRLYVMNEFWTCQSTTYVSITLTCTIDVECGMLSSGGDLGMARYAELIFL